MSIRDALAHFIISLPAHEQIYMVHEAMLPLLKNLDTIKAYIAAKTIGNARDQDKEEDKNFVVNRENNGASE